MSVEYLVGVDLGQANDYTALSILERPDLVNEWSEDRPSHEVTYELRHLERLPLGTPYPEQVKRVNDLITAVKRLPKGKRAPVRLVVDQTGVGRPVVDMLRLAGHFGLHAVSIHGGDTASRDGNNHRVPKRELVSVLQVLLQSKRLRVAAGLPLAETLQREMLAFKVTISNAGHDTYGNDWRENPHDDLVLSVALAAWAAERVFKGPQIYLSRST